MDDSSSSDRLTAEEKYIRKLRKKLRQIERLELLDRELVEEELIKVNSKNDIRKELHSLLKDIDPEEYDIMKRQGVNLEDSGVIIKKAKNIDAEVVDNLNVDSGVSSLTNSGEKPNQKNLKKESKSDCSPEDATKEKSSPLLIKESGENVKNDKSKKDKAYKNDASTSPSGKEDAGGDTSKKVKEDKSSWKDIAYQTFLLEGHNDIILSVDCTDEFIVSASRDTTVKVWRVNEITEERSLRGHTAAVTAVAFLPVNLATAVLKKFESDPEFCHQISADCCVLAVSGGLDCTIRVWDISSGESFGSIYTYNGITALQCGEWGVVTGTEGGKLEVWCITSGRLAFINAFQYQVTALCIEGNQIYVGSAEGDVGIWQYSHSTKSLSAAFIMEPESQSYVPLHRLATVVGIKGIMYFGDSGPNIKVLDWKKGDVTRLLNHTGDIGMTDSLAVSPDGYLLSSSYFIDTGCSSINVRELASGKYICSLIDRDEGRYLAMSCAPDIIVTGGHLLKVWVRKEKGDVPKKGKNPTSQSIYPTCLKKLKGKAVESASEDDTDWVSSSDEEDMQESFDYGDVSADDSERSSGWWCNIL